MSRTAVPDVQQPLRRGLARLVRNERAELLLWMAGTEPLWVLTRRVKSIIVLM